MFHLKYPSQQSDPPRSPKETLPTMYDLPSEDPEEPGLPDEFHSLQPRLLDATCRSPLCPIDRMFKGSDINLYYDVHHQLWYKRPDWFLVAGVERLYENTDLRLSYVLWQEGVTPLVVVELLSPGTEQEDLAARMSQGDGIDLTLVDSIVASTVDLDSTVDSTIDSTIDSTDQTELAAIDPAEAELASTKAASEQVSELPMKEKPPRKWQVYEQILRVPYYVVFSRYTNRMRVFTLQVDRYQEVELEPSQPRVWIEALGLGLGLWHGEFEGIDRLWLRWYDAEGNWVLTEAEQERLQKERERLEKEQERLEKERERLEKEQERSAKEQALLRAEQAEALLEQERLEKERLLERLRQLTGE